MFQGADKYNKLLCMGIAASQAGDDRKALELFLAASKQGLDEYPNNFIFGRIARSYARLGDFENAYRYLKYDDISILWRLGLIRCEGHPGSDDEVLYQGGSRMKGEEARHMADVLCGAILDSINEIPNLSSEDYVHAAKEVLRHKELHAEIDRMRAKAEQTPAAKKP